MQIFECVTMEIDNPNSKAKFSMHNMDKLSFHKIMLLFNCIKVALSLPIN